MKFGLADNQLFGIWISYSVYVGL